MNSEFLPYFGFWKRLFQISLCFYFFSFNLNTSFSQIAIHSFSTNEGNTATVTIAKPSGTVEGNLLVVCLNYVSQPDLTFTADGWNFVFEGFGHPFPFQIVMYKIAGASEPESYTFELSVNTNWTIGMTRFTGFDYDDPVRLINGFSSITLNPTITFSATSPPLNALVLMYCTHQANTTYTHPSEVTVLYDLPNIADGSPSNLMAYYTVLEQIAYGPFSFTGTVDTFRAGARVYIRPGIADNCPDDPNKIEPGICGCGVPDTDADNDGYYACIDDCDDSDDTVYPGAPELCDGKDNDCNGQIDNGIGNPTGITSTVLTATSVYIDWNDSPDADRWQVRYRVQGTATWTTTANLFVSNTTLMGLLANNIYQYQVRARCTNANNSAWSATQTFFLNTCFAPTGLAVTNITSNSALASWNAAAGAISYMIRYRKIGQGWTLTSSASTSKTLTGLIASSNYEVQVASFCTSGAGGWSGSVYFTTAGSKSNKMSSTPGSSNQEKFIDWSLYPNPGNITQPLTIQVISSTSVSGIITIFDLRGSVVFSQPLQLDAGINQLISNDLKLNSGLYFVTIRLSDQVLTKRLIIQ